MHVFCFGEGRFHKNYHNNPIQLPSVCISQNHGYSSQTGQNSYYLAAIKLHFHKNSIFAKEIKLIL